ncbi:MAG TPA: F0F1 ATP synthase subunit A [Tepidisphaeraceae bacterium]|jgi:F-type H+-transporting ATPase subunit a|nr:F0F1 ATP synthase subunit A [Tepidisphaeraceae bacterium]
MTISMSLMNVLAESPLNHIVDHPIIEINGWWVLTNHMVMMCLAAVLMLLIFPFITRAYHDGEHVPTGTRNFFEAILVYFREDVAKPLLKEKTDTYIGYIWTLFFFILFMNVLGLLPLDLLTGPMLTTIGLKPMGIEGHGIFGTATSNFWVTGALALVSFVVIHVSGLRAGPKHYFMHYLGGAPLYLAPMMIPIEILGALIKPFALLVRLGANMTAGHILLGVVIGFVASATAAIGAAAGIGVGIPVIFAGICLTCLELFVAVLQAYLFAFLTTLFISQVISHHDEGHGHDHGHAAGGSAHH